jgi:glucose/arabinose dehydrogenase
MPLPDTRSAHLQAAPGPARSNRLWLPAMSRCAAMACGAVLMAVAGCGGGGGEAALPDNTPTAIAAHAGASQSGTVNSAVATRPAVRVTARDGRGLPGVAVTFEVISGGGSISGTASSTDVTGVAAIGGWTLGNQAGEQRLVARSPGLPEVSFSAMAAAAPGNGTLEKTAGGDNQTASANGAVPVVPSVRVLNSQGLPQAGVNVSFVVTAGGGAVSNAAATSDAQGIASAGRWTLGAAGTQTLTARAAGHSDAVFGATALAGGAPTFTRSVWQGGLQNPWDIAFAPDGAVLFTERSRGLSVRVGSAAPRVLFRPTDFVVQDQSGMLGVALDPAFASNRSVYVFMASNAGGGTDNRIVRLTVDAGYTTVSNRTDIVTGIAYAGGAHSGGRLRFGPDGLLYITTGDNRTGTVPQDVAGSGGKVLRVTRDGTAAPGNAAPGAGNARIFTLGHRNPQGLAFRPGGAANAGQPYTCEHGPGNSDEVTPLVAGGNGGWDPRPRGNPARCPNGTNNSYCGYEGSLMTDTVTYPTAMRPVWSTGGASQGMSGCGFVQGSAWRDWNGALAVALLSGRRLEILRLGPDSTSATGTQNTPILNTLGERLRHVETAPDGALWVLTDGKTGGDEIWRLVANP